MRDRERQREEPRLERRQTRVTGYCFFSPHSRHRSTAFLHRGGTMLDPLPPPSPLPHPRVVSDATLSVCAAPNPRPAVDGFAEHMVDVLPLARLMKKKRKACGDVARGKERAPQSSATLLVPTPYAMPGAALATRLFARRRTTLPRAKYAMMTEEHTYCIRSGPRHSEHARRWSIRHTFRLGPAPAERFGWAFRQTSTRGWRFSDKL